MIQLIHAQNPCFPKPSIEMLTKQDGLVAVSRKLTTQLLLAAYQQGIFPWYQDQNFFYWFATHPRTILLPEQLHIGRSLAKILRHQTYQVTLNYAFSEVIAHCANTTRNNQSGSWISPDFQAAYTELHQLGHAHSFECWFLKQDQWQLVGGGYGVQIGRVFYGESMYAHQPNASKIAFACAVPYLQECGIQLIDCQQETQHLSRFGSTTMPFNQFQTALTQLTHLPLSQAIQAKLIQENKKC